MNDLQLTNEGAPIYKKPEAGIWKQPSPVEQTAQALYKILQVAGVDSVILLKDVSVTLNKNYMSIFWAARRLVLEGLAVRCCDQDIATPTTREPERTTSYIAIKFVEPWRTMGKKKW